MIRSKAYYLRRFSFLMNYFIRSASMLGPGIIVLIIILIHLSWTSHKHAGSDGNDLSLLLQRPIKDQKIVIYSSIYRDIQVDHFKHKKMFEQCPFLPCEVINHSGVASADAVVFPWYQRLYFYGIPRSRTPNQIYIFETAEPILINKKTIYTVFNQYKSIFNMTITTRGTSDIRIGYGEMTYSNSYASKRESLAKAWKLVKNKTKLAAWFVSNKKASRRGKYIEELSRHIQVDFFGRFEKLKCPKSEWDKCLRKLETEYKFYLSFENSIEMDYVTEKLYEYFGHYFVLVVYGAANYKKIVPPHSIIDASLFKSPKELANYLMVLDKNDHLYMEYFNWMSVGHRAYTVSRWCTLCLYLLTRGNEEKKQYDNILEWYYDDDAIIELNDSLPHRSLIDKSFNIE